jgi:hypothetical protein
MEMNNSSPVFRITIIIVTVALFLLLQMSIVNRIRELVYVQTDTALGPNHVFRIPVPMGRSPVNQRSITAPYLRYFLHYLVIRQAELDPNYVANRPILLSEELLGHSAVRRNPAMLSTWLVSKGFCMGSEWSKRLSDLYVSIMVYLLRGGHNEFSDSFMGFFHETDSSTGAGFFPKFTYVSGGDRVLGTGGSIARVEAGLPCFGWDLYGVALNSVAVAIEEGQIQANWAPDFPVDTLTSSSMLPCFRDTRKLFLGLTDSYGKYFDSFSSGDLVRRSGGTFGSVARMAEDGNVDLSNYHYIVVWIGFNDAALSLKEQGSSWARFMSFFERELIRRGGGSSTVLFVPALPLKPKIMVHWQILKDNLAPYNVDMVDWETYNPFFDNFGDRVPEYFDVNRDGWPDIHLSRDGVHLMWKIWCEHLPALKYVTYVLASRAYKRENEGESFVGPSSKRKRRSR